MASGDGGAEIPALARRLRELRLKRGWSQQELAGRIGLRQKQISSYERGTHTPSSGTLIALAKALRVSLDYLAQLPAEDSWKPALADRDLVEKLQRIDTLGDRYRTLVKAVIDLVASRSLALRCPSCGQEVTATEAVGSGARPDAASAEDGPPVDRAATPKLSVHDRQRRAREVLTVLDALPDHATRLAAARGSALAGPDPDLVELLLKTGRERIHDSPREALERAELAVEVARRLPEAMYGARFCRDRLAEARGHEANALRVVGKLRQAERVMAKAAKLLEGSTDDFLRAEVASFAASLAKDQRRWADAQAALDLAERLYTQVGAAPEALIRVRLNRAHVASCSGDLASAVVQARAGLEAVDETTPSILRFIAHHNLACYLCDAGHHQEARGLLAAAEPLYLAHPDRSFRLRLNWLRGRIALGLDDPLMAEANFRGARDGFLEAGLGYDAALVALDLAVLCLEQGRTAEVREIAAWTSALFEANEIHREALAALTMFREAALQDLVTVQEIRRVARRLTELQRRPAARGDAGS